MHQTEPSSPSAATDQAPPSVAWSYEEAFARNRGLITPAEQQQLREKRIAIAGLGGVGGVHLMTLARLGIGRFTIADPDTFEVANFNRQYGANVHTLGRNKAEVMAEYALTVNPELDIRVVREPITDQNVGAFLHEADIYLDGLDFFEIEARRLVFASAREQGIWSVTAGPIGVSVAWLVFDPHGMSFEDYFCFSETDDPLENLIEFAIGLAPKRTQMGYLDLAAVDLRQRRGPSVSASCELCAGVAAAEILKIVTSKEKVRCVPAYSQFDAFTGQLKKGRLTKGNRSLLQQIKRRWLKRRISS